MSTVGFSSTLVSGELCKAQGMSQLMDKGVSEVCKRPHVPLSCPVQNLCCLRCHREQIMDFSSPWAGGWIVPALFGAAAEWGWTGAENCPAPHPGRFGISRVSKDTRGVGWGRGSCPDRKQCFEKPRALGHHQPDLSASPFSHPTHWDQFLHWRLSTGIFVSPLQRAGHQTSQRF